MKILSLAGLVVDWIEETFKGRVLISYAAYTAAPAIIIPVKGEYKQVIVGVINKDWVRVRGRYFYPSDPDFFEKLYIELDDACKDPEVYWKIDWT